MAGSEPPPPEKGVWELFTLPKLAISAVRPSICVEGAGQGQPVIVIPGMMSGDNATSFFRRSLAASGFDARPSGLILNTGATPRRVDMLSRAVEQLSDDTGKPVSIVGWSLGGLFARLLGHRHPEAVSHVMTLGSPFSGDQHANHAWRLYELLNGYPVTESPFPEDIAEKPAVHTIAIWSANDGVIAEDSARGQRHESDRQVQVEATHMEMATSALAVRRIIEVLADA